MGAETITYALAALTWLASLVVLFRARDAERHGAELLRRAREIQERSDAYVKAAEHRWGGLVTTAVAHEQRAVELHRFALDMYRRAYGVPVQECSEDKPS